MKVLRGLYVAIMYILALPLFVLGVIFGGIGMMYLNLRYDKRINLQDLKTGAMAAVEGVQLGHRQNVLFVKYGRNYSDHLEEL